MKINKFILSLILGCALAFSAFTFAACKVGEGEAAPSEQNQSGTNSGDTNNNNGNNNSQGGNTGVDEQEFSAILNKILTDEYYTDLDYYVRAHSNAITPELKPIPFNFLRKQGHNVDAYLDGTLDVFASSYIYDNDKNHIYVSVKAENVSTSQYGNYYTNYVLRYPLTDQEYEEYSYLCKGEYLQGLLFIQELDNQKSPEIINKINVQKETYNKMITEYTISKNVNFKNYHSLDMDIFKFNEDEIEISIRNGSTSNMSNNQLGILRLEPNKIMAGVEMYDNPVMKLDDPSWVNGKNLDEYKSSLQNITSFSYGTHINN